MAKRNRGSLAPDRRLIWAQIIQFAEVMMDKPRSYYAFELLYWTGIRSGELLALTPSDSDFENQTLRINKTFHRSKGEDIITTPKTVKSNRIITLPPFLCDEIKDYLGFFVVQRFTKNSLVLNMHGSLSAEMSHQNDTTSHHFWENVTSK